MHTHTHTKETISLYKTNIKKQKLNLHPAYIINKAAPFRSNVKINNNVDLLQAITTPDTLSLISDNEKFREWKKTVL